MKPGRLRAVRWTELAIVFQGALHTLNPVQRIGRQMGEAIRLHAPSTRGAAVSARVGELLELVGLPARRAQDYPHQLSGGQRQRVLIGAGAGVRAAAADRRRADDGARRHGPGAGAAPARGPPAAPRAGGGLHHARPVDAGRGVQAARGDVRGADRRGRAEPRGLRGGRASVHAGAGRGLPGDRRPGLPDGPVRPGGRPARSARAALRLPVPPALPGGGRRRARRSTCELWPAGPGRRAACVHVPSSGAAPDEPVCSTFATCTSSSAARGGGRASGRRRRPQHARRARSSPWSASRAAARRRWRGRSSACSARPRATCAARRAAALRRRALRAHRREVQMVFQDPTGALNARQTIYEAVAEGVRIQGVPGDEEQLVGAAPLARRPAPARALLRPLPLRDLRRPAPARDHRRGDGPRARACSSPTSRCRASTRRCAARSSR